MTEFRKEFMFTNVIWPKSDHKENLSPPEISDMINVLIGNHIELKEDNFDP